MRQIGVGRTVGHTVGHTFHAFLERFYTGLFPLLNELTPIIYELKGGYYHTEKDRQGRTMPMYRGL